MRLRFALSLVAPLVIVALLVADAAREPASLQAGLSGASQTGTIRGVVNMASAPPPATLKVTTDHKTCGQDVPDESLVVGSGGGVAHAVVTLVGVKTPASAAAPTVSNRECRFVPHVQVAPPGSTLAITSDDKTLHTTHAYADANRTLFNVAIPMPGLTIKRPLDARGVVRLGCDSHPWMRGYVVVTNDMAVATAADGTFAIERVPAGTHELRVWHERLTGASERVTVAAGGAADVTIVLKPS